MAYDAQGKAVAEETVRTASRPHHIKLVADHTTLAADGRDLAYATARVEDAQGNLCPAATDELKLAVSGADRFRAVGNGNPTSLEPFQRPQMHVFHGQVVALCRLRAPPARRA